jgi:transketolase
LHVHTVKPLDTAAVLHYSHDMSVVVTVEEHTLVGGLGSAVTEALVDGCGSCIPLIRRLGIPDVFAVKYGSQDQLMTMYGLQPPQIAELVRETLKLVSV